MAWTRTYGQPKKKTSRAKKETHPLELPAKEQDLKVQQRPRSLGVKVRLSKLEQDGSQVAQAVLFVRRLALTFRLADEAELEPEPIFGRLRHAWDVPPVDLDATDEFVQRVLVRVGRVGQVADPLVVLGKEAVAQELGQSTVGRVEPGFKVRHKALFELLEGGLVLGRERERFFRVTAPQEVVDSSPHGGVVGNLGVYRSAGVCEAPHYRPRPTSRAWLDHWPFFWYLTLRKPRILFCTDGTPPSAASAGREAIVFSTYAMNLRPGSAKKR